MPESYQEIVEKVQSLGESMEEINQLRQNPEFVSDRTELMALTQRMEELCNEVDSCRKQILTYKDKAQSGDRQKECRSKVTKAEDEITGLKNSVSDLEREIRECEQQILEYETLSRESAISEAFALLRDASVLFPLGVIIFQAGRALAAGIMEVKKIQIRILLHDKKDFYRNKKNSENLLIESKLKDIKQHKLEIRESRQIAVVMTSFNEILLHWLQFLKDLTNHMDHLENAFVGDLPVKDTVAYQDYIRFINGSDAKKSLNFAKNTRQITSMNPMGVTVSLYLDD